jgi:protein O-GlcNAc transferase
MTSSLRARLQHAVALHQRGRLADAEKACREILTAAPAHFDALALLGTVKLHQGNFAEAADLMSRALQVDPRSARALVDLGHALAGLDRHDEAAASFRRALQVQPEFPEASHRLGASLLRLGRYEAALANFDRELAAQPTHVDGHSRRGVALAHLGRHGEALAAFDKALALRPDDLHILNNRGNMLRGLQRHDEALRCFDAILARTPDAPDTLRNRGSTLADLGRCEEAIACFDRVLVQKPDLAEAHYNRANALRRIGRVEEAIAGYDRALALTPDYVDAWHNRGSALELAGRFDDAIASYQRALALRPDHPFTAGQCAFCHLNINDWPQADALKRTLDGRLDAGSGDVEPFVLVAFGDAPAAQLARTRGYVRRRFPREIGPHRTTSRRSAGKIRLAYLSADFRRHPTSYLIAELFERHDRNRFEVIGISFGSDDGSAIRMRVVAAFDRFLDARAIGDAALAARMVDMGIDVAIDLNGYIAGNRMGIFAHRPAPLQVSYLGYPATTAAPFIDYVIGDRFVTPLTEENFYTERIVQLPDSYQVNDSTRAIGRQVPARAQAGLPPDGFVFCCFNNNYKITPTTFDVWMRLLRAVDNSVLWLLVGNDAAKTNLRGAARARGIDAERLIFAARIEHADHLTRHLLADLFVDTLPFNAHTTASDALRAGLPLVTCMGSTFAGRVGASLLHAIGLPELVTTSLPDYEALAMKLASDPAMLAAIRTKLLANLSTCPLFDIGRFTRHIETAYATMWERHQSGAPPASFSVEPSL